MNENVRPLAHALRHCPGCRSGHLQPVFDGDLVKLLCADCGRCWYPHLDQVRRIEPTECPGCALRGACLPAVLTDAAPAVA